MIRTNKTIVFDLSEVIIRGIVGIENELEHMLNSEKSKIISYFGGDNLRNLCIGKLSEYEYFQKMIYENKWEIPIPEMKKIVRNNFDIEIKGMPDFVFELSQSNSLILYSDHAREWISYILEKHSFMQVFKKKVFSFDQKCLKSDNHAFPGLLQLLDSKHSELIFVDDNIVNIQNASRTGIETIHFNNRIELEKVLKNK
jgi:FMN phosphatase YigB (HAD superfamily)